LANVINKVPIIRYKAKSMMFMFIWF